MLPISLVRTVRSLGVVACCTVVLLVPASAATADASADDTCPRGAHTAPGSALPCPSWAPTKNPEHTEHLGRKL